MNYIPKEYEEIFEQMLNDSLEKGLISHAEEFPSFIANKEDISNYYVMDKSVIAEMFSIVYEDITNVYNSINIEIAEGEDLDNIGAIVGVPRIVFSDGRCSARRTSVPNRSWIREPRSPATQWGGQIPPFRSKLRFSGLCQSAE